MVQAALYIKKELYTKEIISKAMIEAEVRKNFTCVVGLSLCRDWCSFLDYLILEVRNGQSCGMVASVNYQSKTPACGY